jgi:hypothetical protein
VRCSTFWAECGRQGIYRILRDREDLRRAFVSAFAEEDDLNKLEYAVKEVHSFADAPLAKNDRERLKAILRETDRVVLVETNRGKTWVLMVRIREGKPNIAGFKD